jgi:phage shock protein C
MEPKRLYRSNIDRKLAGVSGGLGEYFGMDPLLIRLVFVILALAGGGGVLIYIVLWIVTPDSPYSIPQSQVPPQYTENQNQPRDTNTTDNTGTQSETNYTSATNPPAAPQTKERTKGSLVGGLVLITIGALFLADELIPQINFGDLWPLILVAIGTGLLINAFTRRSKSQNQ